MSISLTNRVSTLEAQVKELRKSIEEAVAARARWKNSSPRPVALPRTVTGALGEKQ